MQFSFTVINGNYFRDFVNNRLMEVRLIPGFSCTVNDNKSTSSSKRELCLPCNIITRTKNRITILADEDHIDEEKKPPWLNKQ